MKNESNATKGRQQCLNLLGRYISLCLCGDGMISVGGVEYLPIYVECLYPYLSDSVCGAIRMQSQHYCMEITSLRTNHKLFYSVLYIS